MVQKKSNTKCFSFSLLFSREKSRELEKNQVIIKLVSSLKIMNTTKPSIKKNQSLSCFKSPFQMSQFHTGQSLENLSKFQKISEKTPEFKKEKSSVVKKEKKTLFTLKNSIFHKFTNLVMIDGKKSKASQILFHMLIALEKKIRKNLDKNSPSADSPKQFQEFYVNSQVFHVICQALENLAPNVEVRKVRVAGSTYSVPALLSKKKQQTLALKWIIESAKKRKKLSKQEIAFCLADEIWDASQKLGQARQKRDDLHRLALSNRAYVRYRWW